MQARILALCTSTTTEFSFFPLSFYSCKSSVWNAIVFCFLCRLRIHKIGGVGIDHMSVERKKKGKSVEEKKETQKGSLAFVEKKETTSAWVDYITKHLDDKELRWYPQDRKYDVTSPDDTFGSTKWDITIYDKTGKKQTIPLYEYHRGMGLYYFCLGEKKETEQSTSVVMVRDFFL